MFQVGSQLYNLTARDLTTIGVDPFFRRISGQVAAASTFAAAPVPLEVDRALYLHTATFYLINAALNTWTSFLLATENSTGQNTTIWRGGSATALNGDYAPGGADAQVMVSKVLGILLPPQTRRLNLFVTRSGTTNAANFEIDLTGYYIPPGGIGRLA